MSMVNIEGLSKAKVFAALYNAARPQGMGFLHYDPKPMMEEEAAAILEKTKSFDYVRGRVMKIDLSDEKELDVRLYDRGNGQGAAQIVIDELRAEGTPLTQIIKDLHDIGKREAAPYAKKLAETKSKMEGGTFTLGADEHGPVLSEAVDRALEEK